MFKKAIALSVMLLSTTAYADFVKKDWKSPDDQLITLDTESNLEWLNLSVNAASITKNTPSNTYYRTSDTPEGALPWTNDLKGWRIANKAEVTNLFKHAFPMLPLSTEQHKFTYNDAVWGAFENFKNFFGEDSNGHPLAITCENILNWSCNYFGASPGTLEGPESTEPLPSYVSSSTSSNVWLVRGIQTEEPDTCPAVLTEMTRQQAIEYIEHLASQLTDPNAAVITPLNF